MKHFFFVVFLLFAAAQGRAEDFTAKQMKAPVIDGKISEREWKDAASYENFTLFGRAVSGKAPLGTTVWIGSDSTHLYIAFRCMIEKGVPLRMEQTEDDSAISRDDCVEIFLNGSPKGKTYLQLGQSAAGVRFDAEVGGGASQVNKNWSSSLWKNAAGRYADRYEAEFAIPFKMIPFDGSGFLRFNLTRTIRAGKSAHLTLIPMSGDGWHQPEKFAKLVLPSISGYEQVTPGQWSRTPVLMGDNKFSVILRNHSDKTQNAEVELDVSGKKIRKSCAVAPHAEQRAEIVWECREPQGSFSWRLLLSGKELFVSASTVYSIDAGKCFLPPVSYEGGKIPCFLELNYGRGKLREAKIRFQLKKEGVFWKTLDNLPFAEEVPLSGLPAGGYEAEIFVSAESGALLFHSIQNFRVVPHFL